jgi:hypothetical protein
MVAYACAIPPPIPPNIPEAAGLTPKLLTAYFSISAEVKIRTAPLVEASIHAYYQLISGKKGKKKLTHGIKPW